MLDERIRERRSVRTKLQRIEERTRREQSFLEERTRLEIELRAAKARELMDQNHARRAPPP